MSDYKLKYVLNNDQIVDLKICYGVIFLLYYPDGETIPMTICDIHSGEEIAKVSCKREPDGEDTLQIME